jgi:hypothetical protein
MNTVWSGTFLRGVIAVCCIVVIGAAPASYAFEVPHSVDSETAGTADSALLIGHYVFKKHGESHAAQGLRARLAQR